MEPAHDGGESRSRVGRVLLTRRQPGEPSRLGLGVTVPVTRFCLGQGVLGAVRERRPAGLSVLHDRDGYKPEQKTE